MQNPAKAIRHTQTCIVVSTADCDSVLELGCGVGDKLALCNGTFREGVDAHAPYIERARNRWRTRLSLHHEEAEVFVERAFKSKASGGPILWDAIMMIDFIEHLVKPRGRWLIHCCKQLARRRIIVYCPEGNQPQNHDSYGLGGERWQVHRSAWWLEDLEKRGFDVVRWEDQHGPGKHALFAIWNQP